MQLRFALLSFCALVLGGGEEPSAVVTVTTTDFAFQAPDTIPAGAVEFRLLNRGPELHHIWLLRLDSGRGAADLLSSVREGQPLPPWVQELGGPNVPPLGKPAIVTVELTPGRYALICLIPSRDGMRHLKKGMVKEVEVVGPRRPGKPPKADITMTLTDYDFVLSSPLRRGRQIITVRNTAQQSHMVVFLKLEPGKKPADYLRWTQHHEGPPPGVAHGGTTGMDADVVNTIELDLEPGEYGLMCFVTDAKDGKSHLVHGMIKQVRVL